MNYVEWLRVRNCLRIVIVILGILLVLAVILRVSLARYTSPEAWIAHMAMEHDTRESHVTLPDGTKRMVLDNPQERTRIIVDDRGYLGRHIVIIEPPDRAQHEEHSNVDIGNIRVLKTNHGTMSDTIIDTNGAVPMLYYMALADIVALIVATILAAPFAREIDGHLEIALTKPITRTRYALGVIGADVAGILAASFLTVVAIYLCQLLFESWRIDFSGVNARSIGMGIACPLAWYALLCAGTTWLNRSYGAVLGFAWPVAILVGVLAKIQPVNVVAMFVHDVAWVLSRFSPLSYVSWAISNDQSTVSSPGANFELRLLIEVLLFVVYGALVIWQWRRVEA
jgi:hypothetical protein